MGLIDSIKYNQEQNKKKAACKKGNHSPNMESWYDRAGYLHSRCCICGKEIFQHGSEWKEVVK